MQSDTPPGAEAPRHLLPLLFLVPMQVTLLTERRQRAPYGLRGGRPGAVGINSLEHQGIVSQLPGKVTLDVQAGDVLTICTPGGGGFLPV